MDYDKLSLKELDFYTGEYLNLHRNNGGTSEFDTSINDISRAKIKRFKQERGACFLGKINLYDEARKNLDVKLVPYEGQDIYNFQYCFILPCHDEEIIELIKDHNRGGEFNSKLILERINKITQRVLELKGDFLVWA